MVGGERIVFWKTEEQIDDVVRGYAYGSPPYGTRAEDGSLVADDDESELVERVRALRTSGASYRSICDTLAVEGYRPRRAASWSPMTVRNIALRS